jgi:hypothetical protein
MNEGNEPKNIIVVGSEEDGEILLEYDLQLGQTVWAVTRDAAPGDRVWFYLAAPVSAIVATGIVKSEIKYQEGDMQPWARHFVATIGELEIVRQVSMTVLKRAFPDWQKLGDFEENFALPAHWVNFFREVLEVDDARHDQDENAADY